MKQQDIIVGSKYRFLGHDMYDRKMLGIGMRKLYTGIGDIPVEYTEKHLVVIESTEPSMIGRMIQEGDNASAGTWDDITQLLS